MFCWNSTSNYIFGFSSVTAEKDGYVITGPDASGKFMAHKLAEVIVGVSDQADNAPLQVRRSYDFSIIISLFNDSNLGSKSFCSRPGCAFVSLRG